MQEHEAGGSPDFNWVDHTEPHSRRRKEILAKYGDQVKALYGYDLSTAVQVMGVICFQLVVAYLVRNAPWWKVVLAAYTLSATANQNLFCAQHELSHFLAFRKPLYNRMLSLASNCPLVVPMATKFRVYHQEHHSHMGVDGWDVDLPTYLEKNYIASTLAKTLWVSVYIIVYGLRPVIIRPKPVATADVVNAVVVLAFDAAVLYTCGLKSLLYLAFGSWWGGGLHPMAGHLIAEHYSFYKGQETYSYYGPMNMLTYNVGYHNEHHDFPQIPHTRLHKLKKIAPEHYTTLAYHTSWTWVIWKFLTDPTIGPWSRMRRMTRDGTPNLAANKLSYDAYVDDKNLVAGAFADVTNVTANVPKVSRAEMKKVA
jgi:sphingolipid delta-4 desaturase